MARDSKTENWLNTQGVEWEYIGSVDLTEIDRERSKKNLARFVPYREEHVEEMAILYADGIRFPAPIGWRGPRGYVYIDGNHRHGMHLKVGDKSTDMYVVKTKDAGVIEALTRCANIANGWGVTEEEKIEGAKHICKTYSRTAVDVARMFGLKPSVLSTAMLDDEVRASLRSANIDPAKLPAFGVRRLSPLHNIPVRLETARTIQTYGLKSDEIDDLVKEVRNQPSEKAQLDYIDRYVSKPEMMERKAQTRGGVAKLAIQQKGFVFGRLESVCLKFERHSLTELQITTDEDIERCVQLLKRLEGLVRGRCAEWRQRTGAPVARDHGGSTMAPSVGANQRNS